MWGTGDGNIITTIIYINSMTQHLPGHVSSSADESDTQDFDLDSTLITDEDNELSSSDQGDDTDESQSTSDGTEKSRAQLEEERRNAVKAALANNQKVKKVQAQAEGYYSRMLNLARKNPDTILPGLYLDDPQLAEKVAQDVWGKSYEDVMADVSTPETPEPSELEELVQKELEKKLQQEKSERTQKQIEKTEQELFMSVARKYDPKSFQFQKIMKEYKSFGTPSTVKQAKAYFLAAQSVVRGIDDDDTSDRMHAVPSISLNAGRSDEGPMPSREYLEKAKSMGVSREQAISTFRKTLGALK